MGKYFASMVLVLLFAVSVWGSPDEDHNRFDADLETYSLDGGHNQNPTFEQFGLQMPVSAAEIFVRTQAVLRHFKIAPEPSHQAELQKFNGRQSEAGIAKMLPYMDAHKQFRRFASIYDSGKSSALETFLDFDSKQFEDYSVVLAPKEDLASDVETFSPTLSQPLRGLRVALDPGHMGGDVWDERTGKFVHDGKGNKVSEGVINLQTSLLLKQKLQALGAQVLVTREKLGPVTSQSWEGIDINSYGLEKLRAETLSSWFLSLVESAPVGPDLYETFDGSSRVKRIFSDFMRWEYFVLHADLDARAEAINNFKPDITLVIHYDTSDPSDDPNGIGHGHHDYVKAYVPGGFAPEEFATRRYRRDFALHLLNPRAWNRSLNLSRAVLSSMENELGLKPDRGLAGSAVEIEPGLQSRNLAVSRMLNDTAVSYVECLYYNDPTEFYEFLQEDHEMNIGGVRTFYSNRLLQVATALEKAVLTFASNGGLN